MPEAGIKWGRDLAIPPRTNGPNCPHQSFVSTAEFGLNINRSASGRRYLLGREIAANNHALRSAVTRSTRYEPTRKRYVPIPHSYLMTTPFRFKQFTVRHDQCAMKIGTDAILLGAWAAAVVPKRILDIGTGSGVIALMLAQRFPAANVTAVEINSAACEQACGNFASAPFHDRLTLTRSAVQDFRPKHQYDLIVCNPPWFHNSLKPPDAARSMARHSDALSLQELGTAASRLLSPGGVLNVILPIEQAQTFTDIATDNELHCHRVCEVRPTPTSMPKRQLLEFSNHPSEQDMCKQEIVIEVTRHQYSDEYSQLAKEFLLKL